MSVAQFDFDVARRVGVCDAPAWAGAGECRFMSSWAPEIFNQLSLLFAAFGLSTEPLRRLLDNGGAFEGMAIPCMAESLPGENDTCSLGLSTEPLRRLDNGGAFEGMAVPCDSISGEVAQAASKLARASSAGRP